MKKLKKDILLIIKGLKEIHSICKGLLGLTVLRSVVNALVPFINIYMFGLIIDKIAANDKGRIVQRGSHDDLLADVNGKYYELWHAQSQYYAESC